ncbi:MAG: ABC transporter ATP-binding protein [Acidobacteria bacterium]|nr:MAG: ABC transporter ATP-binding protein [Acidobacteriota bacterium]
MTRPSLVPPHAAASKEQGPPKVSWKEWSVYFLRLLRPRATPLVLAHLAMLLDALLTVLRPWPLKVVIDRVITQKPSRVPFIGGWLDGLPLEPEQILYGACATTILIALGTGLSTFYYRRTMGLIGEHFTFDLRRRLFAHMQRLSLRFHDRQRTGDLTTRLSGDINAIDDLLTDSSHIVVVNAFLLTGMLAIMLWINWRFALVALSVSPLLFLTILRFRWRIRGAAREARTSDGLVTSMAQETLASIRVVQGLVQEEQQDDRFEAQGRVSLQARLQIQRLQSRAAPFIDLFSAAGLGLVMWYGATRVLAGELSTGDVVVFFAYVTNLYAPMRSLARSTGRFYRAEIGAERVVEILREGQEVADLPGAIPAHSFEGRIEFQAVSFAYDPGREVLSGIDLVVEPGEKLAIVGSTGAGKSTLVSLLPRFYDPSSGAILIDGQDLRRFTVQSLRDQISLVLQESLLFHGTIRDNIAFGRPEATDAEIRKAAATAHASAFIEALREGYETIVSERGTTLSGGQKQRIAIARATLRDSPLLILDEPTTGLDAVSERAVLDALEEASRGRTTLIIAHRLASVRLADHIVVLEGGRIVEQGSHEDLVARKGRYAALYGLQFKTGSYTAEPLL